MLNTSGLAITYGKIDRARAGDPDGDRRGAAPHAARPRPAPGDRARPDQPLSQAAGQEGVHQDRRVPAQARGAQAAALLADPPGYQREDAPDLRAHGLRPQPLSARPRDPARGAL